MSTRAAAQRLRVVADTVPWEWVTPEWLDAIEEARGDVHRAKRMAVARVRSAGEREVREAELFDVAQPLEERVIDELDLADAHRKRAVDRIADVNFVGHFAWC